MGRNPRYIYQASEKRDNPPTWRELFKSLTANQNVERGDDSTIITPPHCAPPKPHQCVLQKSTSCTRGNTSRGAGGFARGKSASVKGYQDTRAGFARG